MSSESNTSWFDVVSLVATLGAICGVLFLIYYFIGAVSTGIDATKNKLAKKGVNVSKDGLSIKTKARLDRESYVDATQRGLVNAYQHSSITKRTSDSISSSKHTSSSSIDTPESKGKSRWSLKRTKT